MEGESGKHLGSDYLEQRNYAKKLFKFGRIVQSFALLSKKIIPSLRQKVQSGDNSDTLFEFLDALVIDARLRLEVGEFIQAGKSLKEMKEILDQKKS